jgi:hypothetical protein
MAWTNIIGRCENPRNPNFARYGGRGIRMCTEWRHSFDAFFAHVGARPSRSHSLDRIDNDGHYEPGNVRWATYVEQRCNQERGGMPGGSARRGGGRPRVTHEINGVRMSTQEIADIAGVARTTIITRLALGITGEELFAPAKGYMRKPLTKKQRANVAEGRRRQIVAEREQRAAIVAATADAVAANTTLAETA